MTMITSPMTRTVPMSKRLNGAWGGGTDDEVSAVCAGGAGGAVAAGAAGSGALAVGRGAGVVGRAHLAGGGFGGPLAGGLRKGGGVLSCAALAGEGGGRVQPDAAFAAGGAALEGSARIPSISASISLACA